MRILGLHDGSGCAWYRVVMPLREVARHGHDVVFIEQGKVPGEPEKHLKAARSDYDIVVGERLAGYGGLNTWRGARGARNRLVFENDDDVFSITMENWSAFTKWGQPEVREAAKAYSESADLVTVTVPTLADIFRELNPNVAVLPNYLPESAYGQVSAENRKPRIGWVGGASHGRDIHLATPSVRRFIKRFPDWELYLGGVDYRPTFKVPDDRVVHEPWVHVLDDEHGYYGSLDFDIGLAPLIETKFARSKSAIKAMEYGARGIPVIASDATPYKDYIVHGVNGFFAKTDHEWLKYMSLLATDHDLRVQMGAEGRKIAEQHHISKHWQEWEAVYKGLFPEGRF